jgi:hypothetical protein
MVVGAVVVVALAIALVWPRDQRHPIAVTTTTTPVIVTTPGSAVSVSTFVLPPITSRPESFLQGRPAPTAADPTSSGLGLEVLPLQVPFGTPVSVSLRADFTQVAPTLAALVWLDRSVNDGWQTVAWIAQVAPGQQVAQDVGTGIDTGPSPDAITIPAGDAFGVNLDRFPEGSYRLCRYVPLHAHDGTLPPDNPAYVCAPVNLS